MLIVLFKLLKEEIDIKNKNLMNLKKLMMKYFIMLKKMVNR